MRAVCSTGREEKKLAVGTKGVGTYRLFDTGGGPVSGLMYVGFGNAQGGRDNAAICCDRG